MVNVSWSRRIVLRPAVRSVLVLTLMAMLVTLSGCAESRQDARTRQLAESVKTEFLHT